MPYDLDIFINVIGFSLKNFDVLRYKVLILLYTK
jgi:hypothetical protein